MPDDGKCGRYGLNRLPDDFLSLGERNAAYKKGYFPRLTLCPFNYHDHRFRVTKIREQVPDKCDITLFQIGRRTAHRMDRRPFACDDPSHQADRGVARCSDGEPRGTAAGATSG